MTDLAVPRSLHLPRPVIRHTLLNLLISLYILALLNQGFWNRVIAIFGDRPVQFVLFSGVILALTMLMLEVFAPWRLQKPVAAVLIVMASAANYYQQAFGVLIDREMVRNVFETTVTESRHLMTLGAVEAIGLTGVLPASLVFWPRVRRPGLPHQLWRWPLGVGLSAALVVSGLFADARTFSAVLREQQEMMAAYQPGATLAALVRYARQQINAGGIVVQPVATDAARGPFLAAAERPVLLVMFLGETARAQNWGLNGYSRQTTPGLAEREVINFPDVSACGTSTAVSVPCLFSPLSQDTYSRNGFLGRENMLDVLARAGFAVRWVDNNTGDQLVAARTGREMVDPALDPAACAVECTDDAFLPLIEQTLATITQDTVLVLHMIGNHGPSYYLRYAPEDAVFTPDCQNAEFARCTNAEIINAYDNAIAQTDRVLSATIDMLAGSDRALTAMLFFSDHGESLGEGGMYLHAAPLFMAPETQTRVPMVLWMDPAFQTGLGLDSDCLRAAALRPASHDNLFHSVLGLVDVTTTARDPALDWPGTCRVRGAG